MSEPKDDLVERLFASDEASALTNEAGRYIEAQANSNARLNELWEDARQANEQQRITMAKQAKLIERASKVLEHILAGALSLPHFAETEARTLLASIKEQ